MRCAVLIENFRWEVKEVNVFRTLYTSAVVNIKPVNSLLRNGFAAAFPQHTMEGNTAVTVCEGATSEFRKTQFSRKVLFAVPELCEGADLLGVRSVCSLMQFSWG